jgi:hypothetical protein
MELCCSQCRRPFKPENVNLQLAVAKCQHCSAAFDLQRTRQAPARAPVPAPETFRIEEHPGGLEIRWRWFRPSILSLGALVLLWNFLLVVWYGHADLTQSWTLLLLPAALGLAGFALTYFFLACLINQTRVQVSGGFLHVRHGPVPWLGNQRVSARDIKQLFAEQLERGHPPKFQVSALLYDNRRLPLVGGLSHVDQALFLEQQLEQRMHLGDEPVDGEVARTF